MPLPKLELEPGVTASVTGGKCYDDILILLQELHEGVLELGVDNCEVLPHDKYKLLPPQFGFDLCHTEDNHFRVWEFMITLADFRQTAVKLLPNIRGSLTILQGRARLARMLTKGLNLNAIEAHLQNLHRLPI